MNPGEIIRPARVGEGERIAALIRLSLPPELRPLTIWDSPGAGNYVESTLGGGVAGEDHCYYALQHGAHLEGVAVFRRLDTAAFLNHLYIAPHLRGRSLGTKLLHQAARHYLHQAPLRRIALDVFPQCGVAETWYERLGFEESGRRNWWLLDSHAKVCGKNVPAQILETCNGDPAWGFSRFQVLLPGGRCYEIGRLPGPYFRLTDRQAALDTELWEALSRCDPSRKLLLIADSAALIRDFRRTDRDSSGRFQRLANHPMQRGGWKQAGVSRRLRCDTARLLRNLERGGVRA